MTDPSSCYIDFCTKIHLQLHQPTVKPMESKQTGSIFRIPLFVWECIYLFVKVVLKTKHLRINKLICGLAGWMLEARGSSAVALGWRGWRVAMVGVLFFCK